jgi:hypothetical protein
MQPTQTVKISMPPLKHESHSSPHEVTEVDK